MIITLAVIVLAILLWKFKTLFVVAIVNGRPVTRYELEQKLMGRYGKQTLDEIVSERLVTEKAQLSLAASDERKVKLHVEFAERRVKEVKKIVESDTADKDAKVQVAIDSFKNEMNELNNQIAEMSDQSGSSAELAKIAGVEGGELSAAIGNSTGLLSEESQNLVATAEEAAQTVTTTAVEAMVTQIENNPESESSKYVGDQFRVDVSRIDVKTKTLLGRLAVIDNLSRAIDYKNEVSQMRMNLLGLQTKINEAMNLLAVGGYRRAYEIVREIEATLNEVQLSVAQIELAIVSAEETVEPNISSPDAL